MEATYEVLEKQSDGSWAPLYTWDRRRPDEIWLETYTNYYGGYVEPLTDEEIREDLDKRRRNWRCGITRYKVPRSVRPLKKGRGVGRTEKRFVCEKEVKLWSDFEHVAVPDSGDLSPPELEEPGNRSKYVASLSYEARKAGYNGSIVNRDRREIAQYPEPKSYEDHDFIPFSLKIPWGNFQITVEPEWTGEATRYFKRKRTRVCARHTRCYAGVGRRSLPNSHRRKKAGYITALREYPPSTRTRMSKTF